MGLLSADSVTMARLVFLRLPKPERVRLRLPCRFAVLTLATLTPKIFSIAILISVLLDSGCTRKVYTFVVAPDANKIEIRRAVEAIWGVRVAKVNTLNRKGKRKRNRRTGGYGQRASEKRAIVTLVEGDKIEIFGA